jgi:hypothetical protein
VDPTTGLQEITLKERSDEILKTETRIAVMVMDEKGRPVVGAVISLEGVQRGMSTRWGGTDEFVDPVGIADDNGRFLLMCQDGVDAVHTVIEDPAWPSSGLSSNRVVII